MVDNWKGLCRGGEGDGERGLVRSVEMAQYTIQNKVEKE